MPTRKKTKIVATLGPACSTKEVIKDMIDAGVNVFRINFSHADYENAERVGKIVKKLNAEHKTKLWLMLDTKGPEIRTGDYEGTKSYVKWDV